MTTVAVTGHRPDKLGGYTSQVEYLLNKFAWEQLVRLKPDKVITGMALGWDQAIGWAAYRCKIPFIACVPFPDQHKVWRPQQQVMYHTLLRYAEQIIVVCPNPYSPRKMHKRNVAMVELCDNVLALWDGSMGGTHDCLEWCKTVDKPYENVWDEWAKIIPERVNTNAKTCDDTPF